MSSEWWLPPGGEEGRDGLQFGESSSSLPRGGSLLHQIAVHHPTACLVTQGWCPWQHFYTNNAGQPFNSWPPKLLVRYLWKKLIFVCLCAAYIASTSQADGLGRNPERKGLYGKARCRSRANVHPTSDPESRHGIARSIFAIAVVRILYSDTS